MRILRILAIVLLVSGAAERAPADEAPSAEALQAANQLLAIMSPDLVHQVVTQTTNLVWPVLVQKLRSQNIDDATIAELRSEFERTMGESYTDLMKDAPAVYARHFTVDELRQLAAFYQTPVGAKALRELPNVMSEFFAAIAPRIQAAQQQSIMRFNDILRQHGYVK